MDSKEHKEVTKELLEDFALAILNEEKTVSELMEEFDTDRLTILGMVNILRQKGTNIYKSKSEDDIIIKSFGDGKIGSKTPYVINDDKKVTKFLAISDTWYGSKFSQPSIVNEVYKMAYREGCSFVLHMGDIVIGSFPKKDEEGRDSIYADGIYEQAKEVIKLYPYIDGMPTYFITGEHDHTLLGRDGIDIGNVISLQRKDLIYLGPNRRDLLLKPEHGKNGISIRMYHQDQAGTYQVSYKADQYIRAMRSEDKVNIILQGHSLVVDDFIRRGMYVYQVPGLVGTSPEISKNRRFKHNITGAWLFTIYKDKNYSLKHITRGFIPFYDTYEDDYKSAKILKITGEK